MRLRQWLIANSALRNRNFVCLWSGQLVSALGDWIGVIVMPLYVLDMTGQALSVAILMACRVLPSIILGPVAGTLIDRSNKRVLMMVADAVRGLLYIALVFVSSEWQVYALTILLATASTVFQPALRSYMPQIVDARHLPAANALLGAGQQVMMLAGPALGGIVAATIGPQLALLLDSASFFVSLLALGLIREAREARLAGTRAPALDWVRSLRDGIVYVRRAPDVLLILTTGFIGAAGYGVFNVLFPIMAGSVWGSQRNQTYGLIMSCLGAGLAAGSAISGLLGTRYDGLRMYGMAVMASGVGLLVFAASDVLPMALAAITFTGIGDGLQEVVQITFLQTRVKAEYRGRVFAFQETALSLPVLLGMMAAGYFAQRFSVVGVALTASGVILTSGLFHTMYAGRVSRRIREPSRS